MKNASPWAARALSRLLVMFMALVVGFAPAASSWAQSDPLAGKAYVNSSTASGVTTALGGPTSTYLRATPSGKWLAVGDSLVAGSNASNAAYSFVNIAVQAAGTQYISAIKLRNVAVPGTKTTAILASLRTELAAGGVVGVIADGGTNDFGSSTFTTPEQTFESWRSNIIAMALECQKYRIPLVLNNIIPRGDSTQTAQTRRSTLLANAWLAANADRLGIYLVDAYSALVDPTDGNMLAAYDSDGTHPNDRGHWAWGNVLAAKLREAVVQQLDTALDPFGANNLFANPLMNDSNSDGRPDNISQFSSTGSPVTSVVDDTSGVLQQGKWMQVEAPAGSSRALRTSNVPNTAFGAGDLIAITGRIQIEDVDGGMLTDYASCKNTSSIILVDNSIANIGGWTNRLGSLTSGTADAAGAVYDLGPFFTVATATATTNVSALWTVSNVCGSGTHRYRLANLGIFNLTRLGLASLGQVAFNLQAPPAGDATPWVQTADLSWSETLANWKARGWIKAEAKELASVE